MSKGSSTSVHLRLNEELLQNVDMFTEKFYFNNRTEALRYLIALGLNYHAKADYLMESPSKYIKGKEDKDG